MNRTISIEGSEDVMAIFGRGNYYKGIWQDVRITAVGTDENTPLEIRVALVGLTIPTIFTKESIEKQTGGSLPIPKDSRLAYCTDIIEALRSAKKYSEAEKLKTLAGNPNDMYAVEGNCYELIPASELVSK